jgi:pilus assembly protein FimV
MKFRLDLNNKNTPFIFVETTRPLYDLNLGFLLKVSGSSSTIMRRYDVLVAAPIKSATTIDAVEAEPRIVSASAESVVAASVVTAKTGDVVSSRGQAAANSSPDLNYGPIKRGEVLSVVAQKMRGNRKASLPQMIMAIYQQNPHAFLNNNINELIEGSELVINDFASVKANSKRTAMEFVDAQTHEWDSQRGRTAPSAVASAVDSSPAIESRLTIEEVDSNDTSSAVPAERIAGVDSDVGGRGNGGGVVNLQKELLVAEEEIQALRVENEDLLSRISTLENHLQQAAQGLVANAVEGVSILSKDSALYADDFAIANSDIVVIEQETLGLWGVLGMGLVMLGLVALAYLYVQRHRQEHELPDIQFPSSSGTGVMALWRRWTHN